MTIEIENLRVELVDSDRRTTAIVDAFKVEAGRAACVVGPSGAGKSTLLHVLAGLQRFDAGSIRVGRMSYAGMSGAALDAFRAQEIGFVVQTFGLMPQLSVLENVALPLTLRGGPVGSSRRRAEEWLERVGMAGLARRSARVLSVGERQRVALARALAIEPSVLLADEPTAHLDAARRDEIVSLMAGLLAERKITSVVVTHDPVVAAAFDDERDIQTLLRFEEPTP